VYVHHELSDAAIVGEFDLSVSLTHAWKPIDLIAHHRVSPTRHALERHCVASKLRDEAVSIRSLIVVAACQEEKSEHDSFHA